MALVTKMNRCAVTRRSDQVSLMADGKYYHCGPAGPPPTTRCPCADLAKSRSHLLMGGGFTEERSRPCVIGIPV
ncbi:MAG: hypothetical protein ACLU38_15650 [Dysosmobacter sp.]